MLAVGGWLGISYNNPRVDRVAAIIFGAEGGLTGDEAGILLTLDSNNYRAGVSYTFIIIFLTSASILVLLNEYSRTVLKGVQRNSLAVEVAFIWPFLLW